ncbi:hypothetical protein O181_075468 [Austropuccinia psidii MF-1]|uniref:Uncharacterized protein n=1 Tax=Austropuccinia psidii MF-1 TaxID=1389203 RepID=A0A9Q3FD38_9BASI|nr:hypothetical protein [Austropuccinia psidii MF-1]
MNFSNPSISINSDLPHSIPVLALIGNCFNDLATIPLSFLPFSSRFQITAFTLIHSLRIAYLYHSALKAAGVSVGRRPGDVSFIQASLVCTTLVMSGTTMAAILQAKPSSLFSHGSGDLVAAYMLAGIAMKWFHPFIQAIPQLPLKIFCFFIDGFATTFGTISLGLIPTLNDHAMTSTTGEPLILPIIILPLLCGSGASLIVPFFGLFKPRFSFGHPGFLSEKLSVDFWGPWLICLCYGTIVDGRGILFGGTRQLLNHLNLVNLAPLDEKQKINQPWLLPDEAHTLCSLILSAIYIINEFAPNLLNKITKDLLNNQSQKAKSPDEPAQSVRASGVKKSTGQLLQRTEKKQN